MSKANGGKMENFNRIKDENRRLVLEELKYEGFGRSIMRICIIYILRNWLQFTCVALMEIGKATPLEESRLGERRLR